MAQRDLLNRSIEAGRDVSQRTQEALDALVREVAKAAEAQTSQAQQLGQELGERSRSTTEQIVEVIDRELRSQVNALGLATRTDIDRLEARIEELAAPAATGRRAPPAPSQTRAKRAAKSPAPPATPAPAKRAAKTPAKVLAK